VAAPEKQTQKRTRAFDKRLEDILHAAARLMARKGYHDTSIRAVAAETGMSLAGLYYYCRSKEELLYLIQFTTFDSLVSSLAAELERLDDPEQKLRALITLHLDFFLSHMDELKVCTYEIESLTGEYYEMVAEKRRRYFQLAHQIVSELISRNGNDSLDSRIATLSLFGTLNWVFMWYAPGKYAGSREMARQLTALYLHGLTGTKGAEKRG